MPIRRGVINRTSGIPIPVTISLLGENFKLREFVIGIALESEDRPFQPREEDTIIKVARALREEYPECWKFGDGNRQCPGILRAARTLINLLKRRPIRSKKKEIDDLKRWLEFGKRL